MKKLIIAAAIVCAAAMSHAATAQWNWSITTYDSNWGAPVGTVSILYDGSSISSDSFDQYGEAANTIAAITGGSSIDVTYDIVLDDNQTWSKTLSFTVPTLAGEGAPGDQDALFAFSGDIATAFTVDGYTLPSAATAAANGWTAAPEPTSGLLLLIGVAGLALRRRRA